MKFETLAYGDQTATTEQKFHALQGAPIEECGFGVVTFYRGYANIDIGTISKDEPLDFSRKEYAQYQEFLISEDSI